MTADIRYIDAPLLRAHARNDAESLVALYTEAADLSAHSGDIDAASFYLTHAFIFALEAGFPQAHSLQRRLWEYGREAEPLDHQ